MIEQGRDRDFVMSFFGRVATAFAGIVGVLHDRTRPNDVAATFTNGKDNQANTSLPERMAVSTSRDRRALVGAKLRFLSHRRHNVDLFSASLTGKRNARLGSMRTVQPAFVTAKLPTKDAIHGVRNVFAASFANTDFRFTSRGVVAVSRAKLGGPVRSLEVFGTIIASNVHVGSNYSTNELTCLKAVNCWNAKPVRACQSAAKPAEWQTVGWKVQRSVGEEPNQYADAARPAKSDDMIRSPGKLGSQKCNFEAITEGVQQVTIATHQYAAFLIEQVAAVQANQDLRQRYTKKIGYALARGRDVALATNIASVSTNIVGTINVELTSDDYVLAWQKIAEAGLLEESPDPSEDFSAFLSPAAYAAALKVDVFTNKFYNTDGDAIQRAHIGDIYGFPVYLSNLLTAASGGHRCCIFYRGAFALIVQKEVPVASDYLIRNLADGVVGWNLFGNAVVSYPPETPGGGTAVDNRAVLLNTV